MKYKNITALILFGFMINLSINSAYALSPNLTSAQITCANRYCVNLRGTNFDTNSSVQVRENTSGSTITVFAGNDIYNSTFTSTEDKLFFPIVNLNLQNKWENSGLCFRVNNSGSLSNEICNIKTVFPTTPLFMGEVVERYNTNQDLEHTSFIVKGNASLLSGGHVLKMFGNSWKKINYLYNITPNTLLSFDFKSTHQEGEIYGVGLIKYDGSKEFFQVHGTQTWKNQDFHNYSGNSTKTYTIPVGEYFTGQVVEMFFVADEDNHVGHNVIFQSPKLFEENPIANECQKVPLPLKIDCPNDPLFQYQWSADYMNFAYSWYYTHGNSRIGISDLASNISSPEFNKNLRQHNSGSFQLDISDDTFGIYGPGHVVRVLNTSFSNQIIPGSYNHGSMVSNLIEAEHNDVGASGLCSGCTFSFVSAEIPKVHVKGPQAVSSLTSCNGISIGTNDFICAHRALDGSLNSLENSYNYLIQSGNQIFNLSNTITDKLTLLSGTLYNKDPFGGIREVYTACQDQLTIHGHKQEVCNIFEKAKERDIIIVAASGNDKQPNMAWPSNDNENLIGVTGTNSNGVIWQKSQCSNNTNGCGSNYDVINTKYAAPADNVVVYLPDHECSDPIVTVGSDTDYKKCSGTSFSAPIFTSVVALIRTINPLVSLDDVKQILWDSRVTGLPNNQENDYAIPKADKSVEFTLGKSNGKQLVNRLTPMFRMKTNSNPYYANHKSYLSTTIPQVAVAAQFGTYLVQPAEHSGKIEFADKVFYSTDTTSPNVSGYSNFKYESANTTSTRAPFFVFGGHRNPFNNEADDLLPLHHMARPRFNGVNGWCTELADHAYSTEKNNGFAQNNFCSSYHINYLYEGIDGYILPNCPPGVDCYETTNNPDHAQCLKVRYSDTDKSFALMMASEVNETMFSSYGTTYKNKYGQTKSITTLAGMANAECLGYVFPNVDSDSDGVIDGMELVLGTNPDVADTDLDGVVDGDEYPLAGIPQSDPLIHDN